MEEPPARQLAMIAMTASGTDEAVRPAQPNQRLAVLLLRADGDHRRLERADRGQLPARSIWFLGDMELTIVSNHRIVPLYGMAGGEPGQCGGNWVERADGTVTELEGRRGTRVHHHEERWLAFGAASLAEGETSKASAARCVIAPTTKGLP